MPTQYPGPPPEQGIEEEGFFDFIKPFRKAAARDLKEAGHKKLGEWLDSTPIDSPFDVLPIGKGQGLMAAVAKKAGAKSAQGAVLDYGKMNPGRNNQAKPMTETDATKGFAFKQGTRDLDKQAQEKLDLMELLKQKAAQAKE